MSETPAPPEGYETNLKCVLDNAVDGPIYAARAELAALRAELVNCERNEEKAMNHADLMTELADTYESERDIARAELDAVKGERDRKEQIALDAEWERDSEIECADKKVDALRARLAAAKRMAAAVEAVEWKGRTGTEGEYYCCPCCESISPDDPDFGHIETVSGHPHLDTCGLSAALRAFRGTA